MTPDPNGFITRREFDLWTNLHQREHESHSEAHDREHLMTQVALDKADERMNVRLEGMNEFREQLRMQTTTFVTKDMADVRHKGIEETLGLQVRDLHTRMESIETWKDETHGAITLARFALGASLLGIIISIFTIIDLLTKT